MKRVLLFFVLCAMLVKGADAQEELQRAQSLLSDAQENNRGRGFTYSAQYMRYYEAGDSLVLQGDATVEHKGAILKAAEMVYYRALDLVEARSGIDSSGAVVGQPELKRAEEVLRGESIVYDLKNERGSIRSGRIQRDKGFYAGRHIETRTADEFHVREGSYTTCDLPAPHFDFYSPRIKVVVDDMAIARPVYLRVAQRRLVWIPFFIFSLGENRRSGILTPGYGRRPLRYGSAQSEWEVRDLGYYIAPNDFWDATAALDLRQRSGWLGRLGLNYALRYRFNGTVNARLENRQNGSQAERNWRVDFNHSQQLGADANLRASGTLQSNESFGLDNSARLDERLNRTLRSNFSYSRRFRESGNSVSLNASQTKNLDAQTYDTVLPELSFRKGRQPLWGGDVGSQREADKPWYRRIYYDGNARLRNGERGTRTDTTRVLRADMGLRVTAQYQPLSWLNINPSLDESWSDADVRSASSKAVRDDRFGTRIGVSQTFYGLFQPHWGPLVALRHVVKPALNLNYQARRQLSGGTLGVGGQDDGWKQTRRVDIRLDNTLWAKLQRGEEEDKVRLGQINLSTAYDLENETRPLADLVGSVSVEAGRYLSSRLSTRSAWYDDEGQLGLQAPRQFEVRTSLDLSERGAPGDRSAQVASRSSYDREDGFGFESGLNADMGERSRRRRLQLSHYYARTRTVTSTSKRSWVRLGFGLGIGEKWNLDYSVNYNLRAPGVALVDADRVTSELFSLQRRFHDWTATFNVEPSRFHETRAFYFKAQFNDIPQLKFERGDARF
jgi:hypothetical protein